jgi:predicted acyltransferase
MTGKFILANKNKKNSWFIKFILAGVLLVIGGQVWGLVFPINKPLWTSSYVLYTTGLAILVLSFMYWLIDILKYKKAFTFFEVFGVNPLFAFSLHVIWVKIITGIIKWKIPDEETANAYGWIYNNIFQPIGGNYTGSLLFAIAHIMFFYLILLILYKKKIFIKI